MPISFFTTSQILPFIFGAVLLTVSAILFHKNEKLSLWFLFAGSLGMGFFIANLDHFLILWDEQYHALVAKNLANNFLKPTLYANPVLDYNFRDWTNNHIWLHKQPLFLWQMALSIKVFGTSALAIRLPSIILHALIPLLIYRMGKIVISSRTGYFGGLLFAAAYFPLELVAGRYSTDHNDLVFLFYVTASFWAWFEYQNSGKKHWLLLIGVFSGCAVLVKWLMGLLVFIVWFLTIIITNNHGRFSIRTYLPAVYAGLVSVAIFLPWQVFILINFPEEAHYEYALTSSHFFHVIEGHAEPLWFYFNDGLGKIYGQGDLMPIVILFGVILLLFSIPKKMYKVAIAVSIIFVYTFYTLAETKMIAFTLIVSPFIFIGLGYLIHWLISFSEVKIKRKWIGKILGVLLPLILAWSMLNISRIANYHTHWKPHDNHNRSREQAEMRFIKLLEEKLPGENYVIFNTSITYDGHIPVMFFTDFIAYPFIPSNEQIEQVKNKGYHVAIVDLGNIPDSVLNDESILVVNLEMNKPD